MTTPESGFEPKNHTEAAKHQAWASARVNLYWDHGEGPLIKAQWGLKSPFFVREVSVTVHTGDRDKYRITAQGELAKKNGEPSKRYVTPMGVYLDDFPEKTREVIQSAIDAARDLLPRI